MRHSATGAVCLMLTFLLSGFESGFACAQKNGGAVLLEGDRTMVGQVTQEGEYFRVEIDAQSRVLLPKSRVRFVGRDLRAVYEFKRNGIRRFEPGDHMNLARWCLQNGLYLEATDHYQSVAATHRSHPSVRKLAIEIKNHLLNEPEFREHLGLAPLNPSQGASTVAQREPSESSRVRMASATTATMYPQIAAQFSAKVQPILLNRCSQAACHGAQSSNAFRIVKPYRNAVEQVSSDNLRSALAQVSADSEELSPLVRYATTPHSLQKRPGISITEAQLLSELTNWIKFVQNPVTTAHVQTPVDRGQTRLAPYNSAVALVPVQPGSSGLKPVPKTGFSPAPGANPGDFPEGDVPLSAEIDALDQRLKQILGEQDSARGNNLRPQDPFDPSRFNNRTP